LMFSTDSPCPACAKLIINAGIAQVHYLRAYRDTTAIDYLRQASIACLPMVPYEP
jgi:deoxycytidylate deaminase